jgi:hypothetical protein
MRPRCSHTEPRNKRDVCPVCSRARAKRWQAKNRVRLAKYARLWRVRNYDRAVATQRAYFRTPKGRAITRNCNLRKRCFTLVLFNERCRDQNNRCAICCRKLSKDPRKVHADHDHKRKQPRGVLCNGCNIGLGAFADSPERLVAAAKYVRRWRKRKVK